jgi:hypothetical protein
MTYYPPPDPELPLLLVDSAMEVDNLLGHWLCKVMLRACYER